MSEQYGSSTIGWMCSYTPLEIILAGGLRTVKLSSGGSTATAADGFLDPHCCPYVRAIIGMGIQKRLHQLSGLVVVNACDSMRRLYDIWKAYIPLPFLFFLEVPKRQDEGAIDYFTSQLEKLLGAIEKNFHVTIDEEALSASIRKINRQRSLFLQLQACAKTNEMKGSELWRFAESLLSGREGDFERDSSQLLKRPPPLSSPQPRLLISGNPIDQPHLFQMIEGLGGMVVAFDTCTGLRHFTGLVEEDGPRPLRSIAVRYLMKPPCPRMAALNERVQFLERAIQDFGADGVVFSVIKFCDHHLYTTPFSQEKLQAQGYPSIIIENDYTWQNIGQIKTRIQGFIELL